MRPCLGRSHQVKGGGRRSSLRHWPLLDAAVARASRCPRPEVARARGRSRSSARAQAVAQSARARPSARPRAPGPAPLPGLRRARAPRRAAPEPPRRRFRSRTRLCQCCRAIARAAMPRRASGPHVTGSPRSRRPVANLEVLLVPRDGRRKPPMVRTPAAGRQLGGDPRDDLQRVRLPAPRNLHDAGFERRSAHGRRQARRPDAELSLVQDQQHAGRARPGDARRMRSRRPGRLRSPHAVLADWRFERGAPPTGRPRPHLHLDCARGPPGRTVPRGPGLRERKLRTVSQWGGGVRRSLRQRADRHEQLRELRHGLPDRWELRERSLHVSDRRCPMRRLVRG
jgi:hypothetical protein